jgi:hypothetical protein
VIGAQDHDEVGCGQRRMALAPDRRIDRAAARVVDVWRDDAPSLPAAVLAGRRPRFVRLEEHDEVLDGRGVTEPREAWRTKGLRPVLLEVTEPLGARPVVVQQESSIKLGNGGGDKLRRDGISHHFLEVGMDRFKVAAAIDKDQYLRQSRGKNELLPAQLERVTEQPHLFALINNWLEIERSQDRPGGQNPSPVIW